MKSLDQRIAELAEDSQMSADRIEGIANNLRELDDIVAALMVFCGYEEDEDGAAA